VENKKRTREIGMEGEKTSGLEEGREGGLSRAREKKDSDISADDRE